MLIDLDVSLLRAFCVVAELRSFTKASHRLHRTQSAVSMKIKQLERLLDCKLFERNRQMVLLSSFGQALLPSAQEIVNNNDKLIARCGHTQQVEVLRIGTSDSYASTILPISIRKFSTIDTDVKIDITAGHSWEMLEQLDRGNLDLVFGARDPARFDGKTLCAEQLIWVGQSIRPLSDHETVPLSMFPDGCSYRAAALNALRASGRRWSIPFTSGSLSGVLASVLSGLAVTAMPASVARAYSRDIRDISTCLPELPVVEVAIYRNPSVFRKGIKIKVDSFCDVIAESFNTSKLESSGYDIHSSSVVISNRHQDGKEKAGVSFERY